MFKQLKIVLLVLFSSSFMFACGDSNAPEQKITTTATDAKAVQLPAEIPDMPAADVTPAAATEIVYLPSKVVYQEEIYKNWPYTQAPFANASDEATQNSIDVIAEVKAAAEAKAAEVKAAAEAKAAEVKAAADAKMAEAKAAANITATADASPKAIETIGDKPYQVIDGKISANAMEGWKTYNGGGCGACHGKGGIGAVGPNLGNSVTQKLSKDEFVDIVTHGRPGTMMRPHNTNKRVMDNLDNLYAYLVARGDGVLGPENLIKFPLGK